MKYKAFISYNHVADERYAPSLQSALQDFAKPYYKLRAIDVFRDKAELSTTPALWPAIEKALGESEYFILLASPNASDSPWVKREIATWLELHQGLSDKLLIVLTDGKLIWDGRVSDFDWSQTDALPKQLDWDPDAKSPATMQNLFKHEPLYLDQRWAKTENNLSLKNPRFLDDIATIASTMHGKSKSAMLGQHVKEYRKTKRARKTVGTLLMLLVIVTVGFALYAIKQRRNAQAQRKITVSRQLAAQAANYLPNQMDTGLLLALEAYQSSDTPEARSSLLEFMKYGPDIGSFLYCTSEVQSLSFSPDGKVLASAHDDYTIHFWDSSMRQEFGHPLRGHHDRVCSVAFSPDGKLLASGSRDKTIMLWDVNTQEQIAEPLTGHADFVWSLAFNRQGNILASGSADGSVILWDVSTGRMSGKPIRGNPAAILTIAFSPDGKMLASAGTEGAIDLWDVSTRQMLGTLSGASPIYSIAFSPDGKVLVSSDASTISFWDLASKRLIGEPFNYQQSTPWSISISKDGKVLASGHENGSVVLLDIETRQIISKPITGQTRPIRAVSFSPDGKTLAWGGGEKRIGVWDYSARHQLTPVAIKYMRLSHDGNLLLSLNADNTLVIWDRNTRTLVRAPKQMPFPVARIDLSPNNDLLAIQKGNDGIIVSEVSGKELENQQPIISGTRMAFSPNSAMLAVGRFDGKIVFLDAVTKREIGEPILAHKEPIFSLAFSKDGQILAAGSRDKTITLWDVNTREQIGPTLKGHAAGIFGLDFSHDGRMLVSGGGSGEIFLWDRITGQLKYELPGHSNMIDQVIFSPNDKLLASVSLDHSCIIWDVDTQQQLIKLSIGIGGEARGIAFSPDGKELITGSEGITFWPIDYGSLRAHICEVVNRNLTPAEWAQYFNEPYRKTCLNAP